MRAGAVSTLAYGVLLAEKTTVLAADTTVDPSGTTGRMLPWRR